MKILSLLLAVAALSFASCASAPKKTSACCASDAATKACPPSDPHCKAPQKKAKAS